MQKVAVTYTVESLKSQAESLAQQLKLSIVSIDDTDHPALLVLTEARLELHSTGPKAPGPIYTDFLGGALAHRRLFGGGRGQLIARAVGLKKNPHPRLIDLSAGLGRDAFILATLGCDVMMIERNPVVAALLSDGLTRAKEAKWFEEIKLRLIVDDAQSYLNNLAVYPDIIYFDPMYPARTKTALVKKEMRILRKIVGSDEDAPEILALAIEKTKDRVVVKRPHHAEKISGPEPDLAFEGKSSRFDVYFPHSSRLG